MKTVRVTTSEIVTFRNEYTYDIKVDKSDVDNLIEKLSPLDNSPEIYEVMSEYEYDFVSRKEIKQFAYEEIESYVDDYISEIEIL
jgi:hypothetical protein